MEEIRIESVIDIVRKAAELMKTDSFDIQQKDGFSNIVTSNDVAVQNFLCEELALLLPGSGFLCEEEDMIDTSHEYTWIIDPIDGTANYSRGIQHSAICVGLKHHNEMVQSVVYVVMAGEMFWAEKGRGAFLNGRQIHVSDRPFANSIMCTALAVYHKEYTDVCSRIIVDTFKQINDIRRFGAAAPEICYLAMGRCELYFEYLLSPWDFAAASLILTEAGGVLSNLQAEELPLTQPTGVLAANNEENLRTLQEIVKNNLK